MYQSKSVLDRTIAAQVYGCNFVFFFHFLENNDCFCKPVESYEIVFNIAYYFFLN